MVIYHQRYEQDRMKAAAAAGDAATLSHPFSGNQVLVYLS